MGDDDAGIHDTIVMVDDDGAANTSPVVDDGADHVANPDPEFPPDEILVDAGTPYDPSFDDLGLIFD
jgi:hypothetical protein